MPEWLSWLKDHLLISAQVLMVVCSISALGSTLCKSCLKIEIKPITLFTFTSRFSLLLFPVLIRKHETMSVSCIRFYQIALILKGENSALSRHLKVNPALGHCLGQAGPAGRAGNLPKFRSFFRLSSKPSEDSRLASNQHFRSLSVWTMCP